MQKEAVDLNAGPYAQGKTLRQQACQINLMIRTPPVTASMRHFSAAATRAERLPQNAAHSVRKTV